ncbi:MAG: ATPase domain-containing protein, partial [Candidatus ainarchaeum sp.]|nr:ATPase domain-containing protein [Candidatus ainarchaeum sp.]
MVERIPTGIKGFDELIEGGLPKGSVTLVAGTPGTGKSIFCSQIAYNNAL